MSEPTDNEYQRAIADAIAVVEALPVPASRIGDTYTAAIGDVLDALWRLGKAESPHKEQ